jgi:hypothetical protein
MAEEVVVKEPLSTQRIVAGKKLVELLDGNDFEVVAAFWLFSAQSNNWRLMIASPLVERDGPQSVYRRIHTMVSMIPDEFPWLNLGNITVLSPEDNLVQLLRKAVHTDKGFYGIQFSRSRINDVFIDDAYIYRAA